jgi:hypothetical protein
MYISLIYVWPDLKTHGHSRKGRNKHKSMYISLIYVWPGLKTHGQSRKGRNTHGLMYISRIYVAKLMAGAGKGEIHMD